VEVEPTSHTQTDRGADLIFQLVVEPGVDPGTFRFSGGRSAD
jgi:hypothetical protein